MPLVTLTVRKPKSAEFKAQVLDAVHASLVSAGVPDAANARTEDFALIEILWSVGRSVKVKKKLLAELMDRLRAAGLEPENVMVVFKETAWENWAFAGGRLIHT
jgi:phenylpyruvate tautomerase PptA (4-oxalocrotonate tautomerase family)